MCVVAAVKGIAMPSGLMGCMKSVIPEPRRPPPCNVLLLFCLYFVFFTHTDSSTIVYFSSRLHCMMHVRLSYVNQSIYLLTYYLQPRTLYVYVL